MVGLANIFSASSVSGRTFRQPEAHQLHGVFRHHAITTRLSILCLARLLSRANAEGDSIVKRQERDVIKGFSLNAKASYSEEPGALILHAGICAGAAR